MSNSDRRTVLVATDLGEWGDAAVREADRWARSWDARLAVVHCVPIHSPIAPLMPHLAHEVQGRISALEQQAADAVTTRVGSLTGREPDDYVRLIEAGTPYVEIVRAAEELEASLVVIGARGAEGLMRALTGHSAEKVARYAHCPVLVVRPSPASGRILVATDLSEYASVALRHGADLAKARGGQLTALHVVDTALPFPLDGGLGSVGNVTAETMRKDAEEVLRKQLAEQGIEAEARVADGLVVDGLAQVARELPAELVVAGTIGRTGLSRVTLGNTAELAIREMPCSVLVVRSGAVAAG